MTLGQATRVMERADCVFGRVAYSLSAIVPRGRVIAQIRSRARDFGSSDA
jgi:hypothetical protein